LDDTKISQELQAAVDIVRRMNEDDLILLNGLIVKSIKSMRSEKRALSMSRFEVGDAVFFIDKQGERVDATVMRRNKKTLSLMTDDGGRWNVAPELCEIKQSATADMFTADLPDHTNVTLLPVADKSALDANNSTGCDPVNNDAGCWYGGVAKLPAYVDGEGDPYRPLVIMWMDADGLIAGSELCAPNDDLQQAAMRSLQQAMQAPLSGNPQQPRQVIINDVHLVKCLNQQWSEITFEFGATPMIDEAVEKFGQMMPPGDAADTYLSTGLAEDEIAAFFDAAARLYKFAPWKHVPHDECLLCVSIPSLAIRNAVLTVIGQLAQNFAVIIHASIQDYCQFHIATDRISDGLEAEVPPQIALSFEEGAQVSTAIRKEVAEHGWTVASAQGYPVLFTPDKDNHLRPLMARDIAVFEALSRVLPAVLKDRYKLIQAWNGKNVYHREVSATSIGETVTVEMTAPYPFALGFSAEDSSDTLMIELALLAHSADDPDFDKHAVLCEALEDLFNNSPEGKKMPAGPSIVTLLLQFSLLFQSTTIAVLQAGSLAEIIFEIVPRKVSMPVSEAKTIIIQCRLFYHFLKRHYALPQADACLEILTDDAIYRLEASLADSSDFDHQLPTAKGKAVDSRTRKKKRKAARKARKKNR